MVIMYSFSRGSGGLLFLEIKNKYLRATILFYTILYGFAFCHNIQPIIVQLQVHIKNSQEALYVCTCLKMGRETGVYFLPRKKLEVCLGRPNPKHYNKHMLAIPYNWYFLRAYHLCVLCESRSCRIRIIYTHKLTQTAHAQAHAVASASYDATEVLQSCATYSRRHRNR